VGTNRPPMCVQPIGGDQQSESPDRWETLPLRGISIFNPGIMRFFAVLAILALANNCVAFHETFSETWEERWIYSSTYAGLIQCGLMIMDI